MHRAFKDASAVDAEAVQPAFGRPLDVEEPARDCLLSGRILGVGSLGDILSFIAQSGWNGELVVTDDRTIRSLFVDQGQLVAAESTEASSELQVEDIFITVLGIEHGMFAFFRGFQESRLKVRRQHSIEELLDRALEQAVTDGELTLPPPANAPQLTIPAPPSSRSPDSGKFSGTVRIQRYGGPPMPGQDPKRTVRIAPFAERRAASRRRDEPTFLINRRRVAPGWPVHLAIIVAAITFAVGGIVGWFARGSIPPEVPAHVKK